MKIKITHKLTFFLLILISFSACTTGKKALQRGAYSDAVLQSVERLRENPDNKKATETLKEAYPLALRTIQEEIDEILRSNEALKYGLVVDRFESIQRMADEIRRCPPAMKILGAPETYPEELAAARQKAAPEHYDAAAKLLKTGTREGAREAFYLFEAANRFVTGYRDVQIMIEEARMLATLKVVVEQIPVTGRYKISSEFFYNQVFAFLQDGVRSEFVAFYNPTEARKLPKVDEILQMEFFDFVVGATRESDSEKEYTKDSVKVGTATVEGKQVDVFGSVKAKYISHRREVVSSGQLKVQVLDAASRKPKAQKLIPGTYTWYSEWSSFNGDERALTKDQLERCKRRPAVPPPPQDLFIEFTKPIMDQMKGFVRSYYRNQ